MSAGTKEGLVFSNPAFQSRPVVTEHVLTVRQVCQLILQTRRSHFRNSGVLGKPCIVNVKFDILKLIIFG